MKRETEPMMSEVPRWLEIGESHLYEILAIVLPGATVLAVAQRYAPGLWDEAALPGHWALALTIAYVIGFALQGIGGIGSMIAGRLWRLPPGANFPDQMLVDAARLRVAALVDLDPGELKTRDVFNLAYSFLGEKAIRYDKFVALSDLSRSLMVVAATALLFSLISLGDVLFTGSGGSGPWATRAVASLIALLAFWNRRRRYLAVSQRIIYPMLIAHAVPDRLNRG